MSSPLETTEEYVDSVNAYVSYLTSRRHSVDNPDEKKKTLRVFIRLDTDS